MQHTAILPRAAAPTPPADFAPRLDALVARYRRLWQESESAPPRLGPAVPWHRRLANGRASRRLIDELAVEIEQCPPAGAEREVWQRRLQERVRSFGECCLDWPVGYRRLLLGDELFASSAAFTRRARRFAPGLGWGEVGQALRNVWIVNSLQLLLDVRVELTPSAFAYSMLYPFTDNLLDDPDVVEQGKREFNRALSRRLAGEGVVARSERQRAVWRLIEEIEAQYPRRRYPRVHGALLAIHAGQVRSLDQQGRGGLDGDALLEVTLAKGGASVLADGYLVRGTASAAEEDFFFGYGVFLQLLDDLQDARDDAEVGHRTLFSKELARGPLDRPTARLYHLMNRILDAPEAFAGPAFAERRDLIRRNCTFLLVAAVAEAPDLFSRGFRHRLQERWPLGFRAMRRLRRRAGDRFRRAAESRRCRPGDDLAGEPAGGPDQYL